MNVFIVHKQITEKEIYMANFYLEGANFPVTPQQQLNKFLMSWLFIQLN